VAITATADQVRAAAEQLGVACGLSRPVPLADSARGLGEARAAFEMARRDGGCVGPEGLTSLDGLLEQQPPDRLRPFVDQLLGPLLASDARRGTAYVPTLATYLRNDGSLTATARAEFLHVNTVRHRLERVRLLTGRDPFAFDDRVALAIALWAYENLDSRRA
jgi:DNA-binding PucR family transcriptional regulator